MSGVAEVGQPVAGGGVGKGLNRDHIGKRSFSETGASETTHLVLDAV